MTKITPSTVPSPLTTPDDNDFRRMSAALRRGAPVILLGAVLAGGAAYLLAARQTPVYQASSSIVAVRSDGGNSLLTASTFAAPSLPPSALQAALQSRELRPRLLVSLKSTGLSAPALAQLTQTLQHQGTGSNSSLTVQALGQGQQDSGAFAIQARAATPQSAQALADAGAATLLGWDASRAQQRLALLKTNLDKQLGSLDRQLQVSLAAGNRRNTVLERQTLISARDQVLRNLGQVAALGSSTTGSLSPLASAELPSAATSPSLLRSAILAAVLATLLLSGAALLIANRRRIIYGEQDMQAYGVPLLGRLSSAGQAGPSAAGVGSWRESINFLRINVLSQLPAGTGRQVVIASAGRSEGRSSVTAALAQSLSRGGERVLIVDADTHGRAQNRLWAVASVNSPLSAAQPAKVLHLAERLDLLPASAISGDGNYLDQAKLNSLLESWKGEYDSVLIDTPPLLASADALSLAVHASGLVLIAVPGLTSQPELDAVFSAARTVHAPILGLLLNERPRLGKTALRTLPKPAKELSSPVTH